MFGDTLWYISVLHVQNWTKTRKFQIHNQEIKRESLKTSCPNSHVRKTFQLPREWMQQHRNQCGPTQGCSKVPHILYTSQGSVQSAFCQHRGPRRQFFRIRVGLRTKWKVAKPHYDALSWFLTCSINRPLWYSIVPDTIDHNKPTNHTVDVESFKHSNQKTIILIKYNDFDQAQLFNQTYFCCAIFVRYRTMLNFNSKIVKNY